MKVGEFIMKLIFWSGMSQKDVADKIGMKTPVLNDIIKGRRGINAKYAQAFESLFGVPAIVLLTYQSHDELQEN